MQKKLISHLMLHHKRDCISFAFRICLRIKEAAYFPKNYIFAREILIFFNTIFHDIILFVFIFLLLRIYINNLHFFNIINFYFTLKNIILYMYVYALNTHIICMCNRYICIVYIR